MHTNGMHRMTVKYCQCRIGEHLDEYTQLLRARLWPATIDEPETATTFEAMDDFNRLSMLGRLSAYDYYKAMKAATDAVGLLNISVSSLTCHSAPLSYVASRCSNSSLGPRTNFDTFSCSSARAGRTRVGYTVLHQGRAPSNVLVALETV